MANWKIAVRRRLPLIIFGVSGIGVRRRVTTKKSRKLNVRPRPLFLNYKSTAVYDVYRRSFWTFFLRDPSCGQFENGREEASPVEYFRCLWNRSEATCHDEKLAKIKCAPTAFICEFTTIDYDWNSELFFGEGGKLI